MYNITRNGEIFNATPINDFSTAMQMRDALEGSEPIMDTWRVQQIDYTNYIVTFGNETPLTSAISEPTVEEAEAYIESAADSATTTSGLLRTASNFHIWAVTSTKSYSRVS